LKKEDKENMKGNNKENDSIIKAYVKYKLDYLL
jgi:hypothetical protein